jgi:hypothetical protein
MYPKERSCELYGYYSYQVDTSEVRNAFSCCVLEHCCRKRTPEDMKSLDGPTTTHTEVRGGPVLLCM